MATKTEYLHTNEAGVRYYLRHEPDGSIHLDGYQDVQPILDANGDEYRENSGWNADKSMRRAARIPMNLINQWQQEEGFNALNPHHWDAVQKKLNDPDWLKLRTAHWNI